MKLISPSVLRVLGTRVGYRIFPHFVGLMVNESMCIVVSWYTIKYFIRCYDKFCESVCALISAKGVGILSLLGTHNDLNYE